MFESGEEDTERLIRALHVKDVCEQVIRVINGLPAGVLVLDQTGKIIALNSFLSQATGIVGEDVRGRNFREFLGAGAITEDEHPLLITLRTGEEFKQVPPERLSPFVCSFPVSVTTHALRDLSGEITGVIAFFTDVKRLQELEQAVIKAERLAILGQLCAMAMHEVRNHLATVRGFFQLLKNDFKDSPRAGSVDTMLSVLDRANSIIGNYLRLAKPGVPRREKCVLSDLFNEAATLLEGEMMRRGVRITVSCDADLPPLILDVEQFHQVLLNLINNAFEVMPEGGEIRIKAGLCREENLVRIEIEDTGPGIPEEVCTQIFEPFFTTKEKGTGLGLYISRSIIENHEGEIKIENSPQKGCRVVITLPQAVL